jgi:hypothetical protein
MHEETHPLVAAIRCFVEARLLAFASVDRDSARDRVVQSSVERLEVFRADRRVRFRRQLGNGLTDVPIIVHDLRHGEPLEEQVVSVLAGALVDLHSAGASGAQRVDQLIQEQWTPWLISASLGAESTSWQPSLDNA